MSDTGAYSAGTDFLSGGGEMGAQMRAKDWAATPLGSPSTWPQSLRTVVRIVLDSRYSMWMGWGPDLTFFYNDAYARDTLGKKHPWALGRPARDVWAEIWPAIGPMIDDVLGSGRASWEEGLLLFLERSGYPEETYHTFSYSPLYDDTGRMGGMLCVVTEETERVIAQRRVALLRDLAAASTTIKTEQDLFDSVARSLPVDARDLPFSLLYVVGHQDEPIRLVSTTGISAAVADSLRDAAAVWPLEDLHEWSGARVVDTLPASLQGLHADRWPRSPTRALLVPIAQQGQPRPAGFFVAGLNPARPLDEGYRGFVGLFVGQLAATLASVRSQAEERRRAEALAELDRAKTAFFSNVSHELRTPLTLMLGPLEDLLANPKGALAPSAAEELSVVHRNGLRLLALVNTLLDFSRIEAGRMQALPEPVPLGEYTAELASMFRSAVEKAGLALIVECPPLRQPVSVDRGMWEKIVLNLLSNAFKFTLEGSISVRLHSAGDQVLLSVADTGCGIPEAELPRVFERFHRVAGARGRTHEGTGIGLALVAELVKLHEGSIRVSSRVGEGTVFTVSIPLEPQPLGGAVGSAAPVERAIGERSFARDERRWLPPDVVAASNAPTREESASNVVTDSPRARIVLADDNADMRHYLRRLLASEYDVEAVADGQAALECIRARRPDLVLSDVMMPVLDGFGLLSHLRADSQTANVPVILLSARAGDEATLDGLHAGADDYLIKPFSARELLGRVATLLERQRFQRALLLSHEQMEIVVKGANVGVWYCELPFAALVWDAKVKEHFHLPPDAMITIDTFYERIHPDDREPTRLAIETSLEQHASYDIDYRTVSADGAHVKWIRASGRGFYDGEGNAIRFDGITIDITERKAAADRARTILESISDAFFAVDRDWRFTYVNRQAERLLARKPGDLLGKLIWQEYPGLVGSEYERAYLRAANEGISGSVTAFYPDHDRWYEAHVYAAPDGISIYFRDVSERERADEQDRRIAAEALAAAEANAKFRTFFDQGMYFAGVMTLDGTIVEANRLSLDACGFSREDVVGKKFWDCGWWSPSPALAATIREGCLQAAGGQPFRRETEYFVADGSRRFVDLILAPVLDAAGRVLFVAPTGTDITERKQMADEREQLLDGERSARAEAERANRLKDDFLATLSHELRTPLNAILGWAHLLEHGARDAETIAEGVAVISRNARAQTQLIEDLLDMSRISAGKLRLDVQPVDLAEIVEAALESVRLAAQAREIHITPVLNTVRTLVSGDPHRLQQVVWNLLSNAIKFTPKAGRVRVALERIDSHVELTVSDTGQGIAPAFLPHVFEPFRQADASARRSVGGLGLGLAIVRQLVELHGGTVRASSAGEAMGTTFTVVLPLAAESTGERDDRPSGTAPADGISLDGVVVLVVDDEPDARDLVSRILHGRGATVVGAASASEALLLLASQRPHVIVSDIGMPDQDGYELMRRVRRLATGDGGDTPAAALTAYARPQDRRLALIAGYQSHVVKPTDPAELVTVVASLVGRLSASERQPDPA